MPNTRDIRNRIRGVKNTQKITRAMQLVAASKMKKAQDRALQGRPYAHQLRRMLASLTGKIDDFKHPFLEERTIRKRGILVISTDRGLCGSLNANLFREIAAIERGTAGFITIGRKGRQFISRTNRELLADFPISEEAPFRELRPVVEFLIEQYKERSIDSIEVLYPRFRNTLVQDPVLIPFLPLDDLTDYVKEQARRENEKLVEDSRELIFEPAPETILHSLLDRFVKREIYQMLIDARASEHSARMVAMKAATDNANKLTDSLTLQYNKARQAGITQEILEITAAAQH
ncbi:MAG TPA: ATP synthase F1 subunit gamma [Oceanipulchritudo sp.]|nr:ATP synthase F1 subunit gamma [Oceanipulchritudo sp.]